MLTITDFHRPIRTERLSMTVFQRFRNQNARFSRPELTRVAHPLPLLAKGGVSRSDRFLPSIDEWLSLANEHDFQTLA